MTVITKVIAKDYDDVAYFASDDTWHPDIYIGATNPTGVADRQAGLRFVNIPIFKGSTINSAKITFNSFITRDSAITGMRIYGEANSFSNVFSTKADYLARSYTTHYAEWLNPPTWTVDVDYDFTGLESIIQEIIDRSDWGYGNDLTFFWIPTSGSGSRYAKSWTDSLTLCPRLTIDYTDPEGIESIHDFGMRISKEGYNVNTCDDKDCIMTSKLNSMKTPTTLQGETTLSLPRNSSVSKDITHNLGYTPAYEAWYKDENGLWRTATQKPGWDLAPDHNITINADDGGGSDATKIRLNFYNRSATTDYTVSIFYIIFLEDAA